MLSRSFLVLWGAALAVMASIITPAGALLFAVTMSGALAREAIAASALAFSARPAAAPVRGTLAGRTNGRHDHE